MPRSESHEAAAKRIMHLALRADAALAPIYNGDTDATVRLGKPPITLLDSSTIRLVVLARRSFGKSTLLNALINRELLFASWRQATSYPTHIRCGGTDAAEILYADDHRETIPVDVASLKAATAQFGKGREVNPRTIGAEVLDLRLARWPLPTNLVFIDLPGFDDSDDAGDKTVSAPQANENREAVRRWATSARQRREALDLADAALFLLRPDRFLGKLEKKVLTDIFLSKGPAGMIPVFNVEVRLNPGDTPAEVRARSEAAFGHDNVVDAHAEYSNFLASIGIDPKSAHAPVVVAALPALLHAGVGDFGLNGLRNSLESVCGGEQALWCTGRPYAVGRIIARVETDALSLAEERYRFEEVVRRNKEIAARNDDTAAEWGAYLEKEANTLVHNLCARYHDLAFAAFERWNNLPGGFWEKTGRLNSMLDTAAAEAVTETVHEQNEFYKSVFSDRGTGVQPTLFQALQRAYAPRTHTVLPHAPNVGFFDELFGDGPRMRQIKWEVFTDDVDWEWDATKRHWNERIQNVRAALEANLPPPPRDGLLDVPACAVDLPFSTFVEALGYLKEAKDWGQPDFQRGLEASP